MCFAHHALQHLSPCAVQDRSQDLHQVQFCLWHEQLTIDLQQLLHNPRAHQLTVYVYMRLVITHSHAVHLCALSIIECFSVDFADYTADQAVEPCTVDLQPPKCR